MFRIVSDHLRHDLTIFWTHSSFFLLIQGVLASGFTSLAGASVAPDNSLLGVRGQTALLCVIGLLFAASWAWVAWRSRLFIGAWREQVLHLSGAIDRHAVYLRVEPGSPPPWWFGPTSFASKLPLVFVAGWFIGLVALAISAWA